MFSRLIHHLSLLTVIFFSTAAWSLNSEQTLSSSNNSYYEKAEIAFSDEEYEEAIIHLKNALLEDPNNLSSHILLGKAYLEEGLGTFAEEELKEAENLGADRTLITEDLARALMLQVKFNEVLKRIQPLGKSIKTDSTLLVYRGQSYFNLGQLDKAKYEYEEALSVYSRNVEAYLGLSALELSQDKFKEAERYLGRAVDLDHQNPSVWYMKGSIHHAQNQIELATDAFNTALEINPDHFNSKLSIAGLYMDKRDYQSAIKSFTELYESSPENPQIAYFLSVANLKLGNKDRAKELMREAKTHMDRYPVEVILDHGPTLMLAGLIHYDLTEYQIAKNYLISFVNRYQRDVRSRLILGRIYLQEGAWKKATTLLEPALQYNPRNYQLLLLLGDSYMKRKEYFKASQIFELAAEYYPEDSDIKTKAGLNNLLRGNTKAGLDSLSEAVELDAQAVSAGFILVTNLLKNNRIEDALTAATRLSEKSPDNLIVKNLLATSQLKAGLWKEARQTWQNTLVLDPGFKLAVVNLIKLDIKEGRVDQAEANLRSLLAADPENTIYLYDLSEVQLRKNESKKAIKTLEKLLTLDSKSYKATDRLVHLYIANNEPGKAVKIASKLAGEYYEHAGSYYLLGKSQIAFGEPYKARSSLKKASNIAAHDSIFLKSIAKLQLEVADIAASIHSINKYLDNFSDDPQGWHHLATASMRLERKANIDKPVEELKRLGYEALANQLLGDLAYQQLDYVKAQERYRLSLNGAAVPETAQKLFTAISADKGMTEGAKFLAKWLKTNPNAFVTREILARAYVTTGQYEKAKQQLDILVENGWESPMTIVNLAYIYQKNADSRAAEMAAKAIKMLPEDPFALDIMGWNLVQEGDLKKGLSYLRDANARDGLSATIQYHIAYVLHKMGRDSEAISYLTEIVDTDEVYDDKEEARSLLGKIQQN